MATHATSSNEYEKDSAVIDSRNPHDEEVGETHKTTGGLHRDLKNRHMQMIAIGKAYFSMTYRHSVS